jgi:hypothetical protein
VITTIDRHCNFFVAMFTRLLCVIRVFVRLKPGNTYLISGRCTFNTILLLYLIILKRMCAIAHLSINALFMVGKKIMSTIFKTFFVVIG